MCRLDDERRDAFMKFYYSDMGQNGGCAQNVAFGALTIAIVLLLLCGCKTTTQYIPIEVRTTDTLTKVVDRWDSIYVHDSISTDRTTDTVRIERWHTKYIERWRHDTLYQATHDTVPAPYPVEVIKKVEKDLTWWQQTKIHLGGIVFWMMIIFGVGWVIKKKFKIW